MLAATLHNRRSALSAALQQSPDLLRFDSSEAVSVAVAGVGYVVVAFARLRCADGAAYCGVGDRRSDDLENAGGYVHEGAVLIATLLLVIAMTAIGIALLRAGRRSGGIASLAAAGATGVTFLLVRGDSPGGMQRIWVGVMTIWAAGAAVWTLSRDRNVHLPSGAG